MMVRRSRLFGGERCLMECNIDAVATSTQAITTVARTHLRSDTFRSERAHPERPEVGRSSDASARTLAVDGQVPSRSVRKCVSQPGFWANPVAEKKGRAVEGVTTHDIIFFGENGARGSSRSVHAAGVTLNL